MCLNIGTPKNFNFSFETDGKLMALGIPILKHFRVITFLYVPSFRHITITTLIKICIAYCPESPHSAHFVMQFRSIQFKYTSVFINGRYT